MSDVGEFDTPIFFVANCLGIASPMAGFGCCNRLLCSAEGYSRIWLVIIGGRAVGFNKDLATGTKP